ncbi:MAG: hypothetical protein NVS2B9_04930 [Myxococcales bacterium]
MSSRLDPAKPAPESRSTDEGKQRSVEKKRVPGPGPSGRGGRFDKAFPVWLEGDRGVSSGIARNVTETGMFVETREPFALGTTVRVTFCSPSKAVGGATEMTLEAEVRYQCFINYSKPDASHAGMRGIGLKFVASAKTAERKGTLH